MAKTRRAFGVLAITLALVVGPAAFVALARGSRGIHSASASPSIAVVLVQSADDVPNYGDVVTFDVSTDATTRPFLHLGCVQDEDLVYSK